MRCNSQKLKYIFLNQGLLAVCPASQRSGFMSLMQLFDASSQIKPNMQVVLRKPSMQAKESQGWQPLSLGVA
jgi:hypothetical protein